MTNHADCAHCTNAQSKNPGRKSVSGGAEWHVFRRNDNKFAWHLIGDNGSDIIATDGSQGYDSAVKAAEQMKKIRSGHYGSSPMQPQ